jgi:hypothetical protein
MTLKKSLSQIFGSLIWLGLICAVNISAQTTFGTSEDNKSLGYPDGRKIVRDSSGNLYAAFRKKYNSYYQIFVSKSTNGGASWTTPANPISTVSGSYNQRVPAMAIDSNNVLHVVWYGQDSTYSGVNERQIKYSSSADGGNSWLAWRNIAPVSGYAGSDLWQEHPVIYVDAANKLYVVWEGGDPSHTSPQAKFIKSTNSGSSWTSWINIAPLSTNQSRPTLVVDSAGKIFVIAYGYWSPTASQNILYATSTDGGATFSGWNAVSAASADQRHPSAAIDSGNKIHLVWREETGNVTNVRYSKFTSPNWAAAATISATSGYYQFFPSIANASGSQYVVWTETTNASGYPSENPATGRIVLAKRLQGSSTWTKSNVTSVANNVWGSLRWSANSLNGGTIDLVFQSGAASPFALKYQSLGVWGQ